MRETKKYYSISEVAENLQISTHQLRYLEQKFTELEILKVKNRRYYTIDDITFLRTSITKTNVITPFRILPTSFTITRIIDIEKINLLIKNFQRLAKNIESELN